MHTCKLMVMDGWDDMHFYVLYNSIAVISRRCKVTMKGCMPWIPVHGWKLNLKREHVLILYVYKVQSLF